jgi:preprotein translocase subunit SecD
MIDFPKWKYALVILVMLAAALFFLPNLFPQDPAVQVQPARAGTPLDEAAKGRIEGNLQAAGISFKRIEKIGERMLIRFTDTESQLNAATVLREDRDFSSQYTVALNLASNVPNWLEAIGAGPMVLGLDLRGGVHFLMQVDQNAVRSNLEERYTTELYTLMRGKQISYRGVTRTPQGLLINLVSETDAVAARDAITTDLPDLQVRRRGELDLIAEIRPEKIIEAKNHAIEQNTTTLRNRVASLAEPVIQRQGADRIVVQLPGIQDTSQAKRLLGATATLEYRAVDEQGSIEDALRGRIPPESRLYYTRAKPGQPARPVLLKKSVIASGDNLINATATIDQRTGTPAVSVTLDAVGGKHMLDFTSESVGRPMAVVYVERIPEVKMVDGKEERGFRITEEVISVATIQGVFSNQFQTTGLDSTAEANDLAVLLRAGSLAAPVDIIEERVIGPSLGADNIRAGLTALLVGMVLSMIFTTVYYRLFGFIAVIGLLANLMLLGAVLSLFGATLTLPGIAGIVLTLGMAVDANVLINERIREELRNGNTPLNSIRAGYEKAWATIIDSNLTTLIAALALLAVGSGPIRGFSITLSVGILTTMFTAVVVTEAIVAFIYRKQRKLTSVPV